MTTAYADAARRILEGGPYSDTIIHLPNATMGASSHGYPSPKEARSYFKWRGLAYNDAWDALPAKDRLAAYVTALKSADGGKHGLTVGPGGLFDWLGRPVVVWQLAIVMRGAAMWLILFEDQTSMDMVHVRANARLLIRRCIADILTHGSGPGYDSADQPVPPAATVHDAFQSRWPIHVEPVKIPHGGTTLWVVPACHLARRSGALSGSAEAACKDLGDRIMAGANPTDQDKAETVWAWYAEGGNP